MTTKASDDLALIMAVREASRAITWLYVEAEESVVNDVQAKVEEAFKAYQLALAARERAVWLEVQAWCEKEVKHWNPAPENAAVLTRQQARAQEAAEIGAWCRQQAEAVKL